MLCNVYAWGGLFWYFTKRVFKNWMKSTYWQSKRPLSVRLKPKNTGEVISVYRSDFTVNDGFPVGKAEIHSSESQERSYSWQQLNKHKQSQNSYRAANTSFIWHKPTTNASRINGQQLSQHPLVSCSDLWGFSHGVHVQWEWKRSCRFLSFPWL